MTILILLFCLLLYYTSYKRSVVRLFAALLICSLFFSIVLYGEDGLITKSKTFHFIWIVITLCLIILPWRNFRKIQYISCENEKKVDNLAKVLIILTIFLSISSGILSYYVIKNVADINVFKYVDGPTDFYYSLGIDLRGFLLTTLLYPISYLLIPLFFYYLSRKRKLMVTGCFIGSLLSIFYGLTYFSRSHMIHFVLLYLFAFVLLKNTLSSKQKKTITIIFFIFGILVISGFTLISMSRFDGKQYSTAHNTTHKIENTTLLSAMDYVGMWWSNSEELFSRFDFNTLKGGIAFGSLRNFVETATFGLIKNNSHSVEKDRYKLMREYSGSFIGVGAYTLYDFGPFIGLFVYLLYFLFLRKLKPRNSVITIHKLLYTIALAQLPLFAIFYSSLNIIILLLFFLIPISLYLRIKFSN